MICVLVFGLSGCVSYKAVGKLDDQSEVFVGNVAHNLMTGGGKVEFSGVNSGISCEGIADRPDKYPLLGGCAGQEGNARARCNDGRYIQARWYATSCTTGYGRGATGDQVPFTFTFGLTKEEALDALNLMLASKENSSTKIQENKTRVAIDICKSKGLKEESSDFKICVLEKSE